eukprot:CAMPEP_0203936728 /NCGR_PEP_ID=MMETSP0359-20131031/74163_1 /ASSEMBLY_ACC=CAM_ASM_000338 /TAXON_ID=268821 /ORGANISM="Scrippsiella Hangoei, Strain SHTV-5" /LENGTH=40 /DNA_ID= /DNA_START= /DNA_END= /DNA_ORIENTATION=
MESVIRKSSPLASVASQHGESPGAEVTMKMTKMRALVVGC